MEYELCHIAVPHHCTAFFDLLDRVMPDRERWKQRLKRILA
ncbi:YgjP-like metallopeptidase domain-containing protein [Sedimentitalea arenosa]